MPVLVRVDKLVDPEPLEAADELKKKHETQTPTELTRELCLTRKQDYGASEGDTLANALWHGREGTW